MEEERGQMDRWTFGRGRTTRTSTTRTTREWHHARNHTNEPARCRSSTRNSQGGTCLSQATGPTWKCRTCFSSHWSNFSSSSGSRWTTHTGCVCHLLSTQRQHDDEHEDSNNNKTTTMFLGEAPSAKCMLVRMVNGVPLLDSAEASACGLVQGMVQQQSTWNSFGLHISNAHPMPTATTLAHQFWSRRWRQ